jgi:hypothetical protein
MDGISGPGFFFFFFQKCPFMKKIALPIYNRTIVKKTTLNSLSSLRQSFHHICVWYLSLDLFCDCPFFCYKKKKKNVEFLPIIIVYIPTKGNQKLKKSTDNPANCLLSLPVVIRRYPIHSPARTRTQPKQLTTENRKNISVCHCGNQVVIPKKIPTRILGTGGWAP